MKSVRYVDSQILRQTRDVKARIESLPGMPGKARYMEAAAMSRNTQHRLKSFFIPFGGRKAYAAPPRRKP